MIILIPPLPIVYLHMPSNSVCHMSTETALPPESTTLLNSLLSSSHSTTSNPCSFNVTSRDCIIHSNGSLYNVNMADVSYQCLQAISDSIGPLTDQGANGGLASADFHMLEYTEQYADIMGVGQVSLNALPLVTCDGTIHMTQDPVVLIVNQYTFYGKVSTVQSVWQLSHFGLEVDDQSSAIPGHKQCMVTPDQWIIPFNIINGLTRMPMQPSTDEDLDTLPHVIVTSDETWDPTVLDHSINIENNIYCPAMDPMIDEKDFTSFDNAHLQPEHIYIHCESYGPDDVCDVYHNKQVNHLGFDLNTANNSNHLSLQSMIKNQDYEALCPYLLWLPIDHIRHMLASTTQQLHNAYHIPFHKHFKSHFPATNITCYNEPVTTDTMFSDEPAQGTSATAVQIFIGHNSKYMNVCGVATDHDLSCTLEENIMNQEAMDVLISDNAQASTSKKVKYSLHMCHIKSYTSESHHQHQNYVECCTGQMNMS